MSLKEMLEEALHECEDVLEDASENWYDTKDMMSAVGKSHTVLEALLKSQPEEIVDRMVETLAAALRYAHERGLANNSLKYKEMALLVSADLEWLRFAHLLSLEYQRRKDDKLPQS